MQFCCSADSQIVCETQRTNDSVLLLLWFLLQDVIPLISAQTQLNSSEYKGLSEAPKLHNHWEHKPVTMIEPWELSFVWLLTRFLILQRYPVNDSGKALTCSSPLGKTLYFSPNVCRKALKGINFHICGNSVKLMRNKSQQNRKRFSN